MYKLLRTVCNASSLEMNSENKKKQKTWETTQAVAVLNSQILYHRILGFGATTTQKQEARRGRPASSARKSYKTWRRGRQDTTAQQSYLIHIQILFLWYEEIRTQ